MITGVSRRLVLGVALLWAGFSFAGEGLPICFVPGAGGGSDDVMELIPELLKKQGIEFIPFDVGFKGAVQKRAARFVKLFEAAIQKRPNFHCHMFAYSMGGITTRYVYNHLKIRSPEGEKTLKDFIVSYTTFSSPHRGTPFANLLSRYMRVADQGLNQISVRQIGMFNSEDFPETYSPLPTNIPIYSFQTYVEADDEIGSWLQKAGFNYISRFYRQQGLETRNDGLVPLLSQGIGQVVARLHVSHGFFSNDMKLRPWATDVFAAHWQHLEGDAVVEPQMKNIYEGLDHPIEGEREIPEIKLKPFVKTTAKN